MLRGLGPRCHISLFFSVFVIGCFCETASPTWMKKCQQISIAIKNTSLWIILKNYEQKTPRGTWWQQQNPEDKCTFKSHSSWMNRTNYEPTEGLEVLHGSTHTFLMMLLKILWAEGPKKWRQSKITPLEKSKEKIMSKENLSVEKPFLSHPFSRYLCNTNKVSLFQWLMISPPPNPVLLWSYSYIYFGYLFPSSLLFWGLGFFTD